MKTIDIEGCWYLIIVRCPQCGKNNSVDGHDRGHHPVADILECGYCGSNSWLGTDTEDDVFGEPRTEVGLPFGS